MLAPLRYLVSASALAFALSSCEGRALPPLRQAECRGAQDARRLPLPASAAERVVALRYRALAEAREGDTSATRGTLAQGARLAAALRAQGEVVPLEASLRTLELLQSHAPDASTELLLGELQEALEGVVDLPASVDVPGCTTDLPGASARALVRLRRGTVALMRGRHDESAEHFGAGLAEFSAREGPPDRDGDRSYEALLWNNLAELELRRGDRAAAMRARTTALRLAREAGAEHTLALASGGLALQISQDEEPPADVRPFLEAVDRAEAFVGGRSARGQLVAKLRAVRAGLLAVDSPALALDEIEASLGALGAHETAFELLGIHAMLAHAASRVGDREVANQQWQASLDQLPALWSQARDAEAQREALGHAQRWVTRALRDALRHQEPVLALLAMERSKEIGLLSRFADLTRPILHPAGLDAVRAALGPRDVMVHLDRVGNEIVLLTITDREAQLDAVSAEGIDAAVAALRSSEDRAARELLGQRLLGPVLRDRASATRLILVPRGSLHTLPWAALRVDGEEVVHRVAILSTPSASQWLSLAARGGAPQGAAALAVVVDPSAFDPAAACAAAGCDEATRVLTHASELRGIAVRSLDVTAHGEFVADEPMRSYVQLAPSGADDGVLDLARIGSLGLRADVVVLHSCEASLGEPAGGDQIDSVARAMLAGGAHTVIAPLFVNDRRVAAAMARAIHQRLRQGMRPDEALRAAQSELAQSDDTALAAPLAWGSYLALGGASGLAPL